MAGEQKGKAYEAFVKLTLEVLKSRKVFTGNIFWDERPDKMTIIPDLSIGRDKDNPHTVILVNHSGSAKNSDMKYWRNMGELAEAKILLPSPPRVFNLAFDSVIKESLKKAQAASFDGQFIVGDLAYGIELEAWIDANLHRFPQDKHKKVDFLRKRAKTDAKFKGLLTRFSLDLEGLLRLRAPAVLDQIWASERKRPAGRAPRARNTFVRRGLSKLLIFENTNVARRLFTGKRVKAEEVPDYAYELGLATKVIGRASPADNEVGNALQLLDSATIDQVIRDAPIDKMQRYIAPLRSLSQVKAIHAFVSKNLSALKRPKNMLRLLRAVHKNPTAVIPVKVTLTTNWLFFFLVDLFNAHAGRGQAFGYAQMLRKIKRDTKAINAFLKAERLPALVLRGQSFIVRGLTDWLGRLNTPQAKAFSPQFQAAVAYALSQELATITRLLRWEDVRLKTIASNLEQKLVTYRDFQALRSIIQKSVAGRLTSLASCFGERAGLRLGSTETTVYHSHNTLIAWQSASDAGRDHKKKELCGRAVALRYTWDNGTKRFVARPGVRKLVLVVDGTWRREDLTALAQAGWDEIFYPDEMDKLAKAIV